MQAENRYLQCQCHARLDEVTAWAFKDLQKPRAADNQPDTSTLGDASFLRELCYAGESCSG